MVPLVIYHANCADGFGAAFAAWLKLGDEAEYLPMQYGKEVESPDGFIDRDIYILDFSFPKDVMEIYFSNAKRVVWLDHHKTAFEMWCGDFEPCMSWYSRNDCKDFVILDNNKSGAMLAWEYFHPDKEVPMLIKHIDDYDRWQFKIEGTKEFNKALWSYAPWSFTQWNELFISSACVNITEEEMLLEGAAILRAHEQNVKAVVKGAARECKLGSTIGYLSEFKQEKWIDNIDGLAANCPPHLTSDVGHQLASQSGTYGLLWYMDKDDKCKCSLRSNGDYDVSAIAKTFGGGGHKNAAGFEVSIQTLLEWIK